MSKRNRYLYFPTYVPRLKSKYRLPSSLTSPRNESSNGQCHLLLPNTIFSNSISYPQATPKELKFRNPLRLDPCNWTNLLKYEAISYACKLLERIIPLPSPLSLPPGSSASDIIDFSVLLGGDVKDRVQTICDAKPLWLTSSLHGALRRLRLTEALRFL